MEPDTAGLAEQWQPRASANVVFSFHLSATGETTVSNSDHDIATAPKSPTKSGKTASAQKEKVMSFFRSPRHHSTSPEADLPSQRHSTNLGEIIATTLENGEVELSSRKCMPRSMGSSPLAGRESAGFTAPIMKSEHRHQVVEVCDTAKWNMGKSKGSLPVGIVGLLDQNTVPWIFDDDSFMRRNHVVANLLKEQRHLFHSKSLRDLETAELKRLNVSAAQKNRHTQEIELLEQLEIEFAAYTEECQNRISAERIRSAKLQSKMEVMQRELDESVAFIAKVNMRVSEKTHLCIECQNEEVDHMLLPCCHTCYCNSCVRFLEQCPICQLGVESIHELKFK